MTNTEIADYLERYNEWRRGEVNVLPAPIEIGKVIDLAVERLRGK